MASKRVFTGDKAMAFLTSEDEDIKVIRGGMQVVGQLRFPP